MHTSLRGRGFTVWARFAVLLTLAGCRDAAAPLGRQSLVSPQFNQSSPTDIPILQQAAMSRSGWVPSGLAYRSRLSGVMRAEAWPVTSVPLVEYLAR